jgi:hypothetical protein
MNQMPGTRRFRVALSFPGEYRGRATRCGVESSVAGAIGHRGLVVCTTRVRTDEELREGSKEYSNHALALTLLGTYLVDFCRADIRRRGEIAEWMVEDVEHGAHARRVIAAYERMFAGMREVDILHALGYFHGTACQTQP